MSIFLKTKFQYYLLVLFGFLVFSCAEKGQQVPAKQSQETRTDAFSEEINLSENETINLLPKAKKETATWLAFITARAEVKRFENYTLQEVANNAAAIAEIMEALYKTVPKTFQVRPVLARINVLVTLSNILNQTASNPNATAIELKETAEKIPMAFQNLKIQLNEVYRKGLEDFQLELEKQADTIQKPEPKIPVLKPLTNEE